ncbi:MAG: hypothetical protein A2W29_05070 [Gemmatimonadetes bacterium RBG_16_66_8]|nr:MAG: hypothetical protein A2W29_05070 [Gemmatimonadetes bacterium RBG_16_66_8]
MNVRAGLSSDSRKAISFWLSSFYSWNELDGWGYGLFSSINVRPTPTISASIGPEFSSSRSTLQYVRSQDDATATATFGRQYVFAEVLQKSLDLTTRLNVTFTPDLTLQLYAQPFAATGDYGGFRELARARSLDHVVYGETPGSTLRCFDQNDAEFVCGTQAPAYYLGDPDGAGPRASVRMSNPDFASRSLRGNAVLRWEYRPGSTLFLVWTRSCSAFGSSPQFGGLSDLGRLCEGPSDNVFAVKLNYWLSL